MKGGTVARCAAASLTAAIQCSVVRVCMGALRLRQVYRAMRNNVQDAAVKLLTNVDAAQLATFSHVIHTLSSCTTGFILFVLKHPTHSLLNMCAAQTCTMLGSHLMIAKKPALMYGATPPLCPCR